MHPSPIKIKLSPLIPMSFVALADGRLFKQLHDGFVLEIIRRFIMRLIIVDFLSVGQKFRVSESVHEK